MLVSKVGVATLTDRAPVYPWVASGSNAIASCRIMGFSTIYTYACRKGRGCEVVSAESPVLGCSLGFRRDRIVPNSGLSGK
jgi:hypothetical protein